MLNKWVIEGFFGKNAENLQRISLNNFPVVIGRDPGLEISLQTSEVSRNHARLSDNNGQLTLIDLNSTNGTYVNRQQIKGDTVIHHGDVVHFANCEVRFLLENAEISADDSSDRTTFNVMPLTSRIPTGLRDLLTLIEQKAIKANFQPIVTIDGQLYGFEVLGRGSRQNLPQNPMELFVIAESMFGKAAELSEVMRDVGVAQAFAQSPNARLFVNTHPDELRDMPYLLGSLTQLRQFYPELPLVLEIHENAITNITAMKDFTNSLKDLAIELAFDDFGAGQSRLMELTDVPVDYVKFDIALIRNLFKAPESKRKMVAALAAMTRSMGVKTLAEGVEVKEEAELCAEMEFDFIQGYLFGRPSLHLKYPQDS